LKFTEISTLSLLSVVDMEAFRKDIDDLGKKLGANQGPQDTAHLEKIINWRWA
jgi:hypothetical protein